jgi:hypothetical protein
MSDGKVLGFDVSSGYGYKKREPYIEIHFMGRKTQMSPEAARDIAFALLAAAEAAYSDAFLVEFANEAVGIEVSEAAVLLQQFRVWRLQKQKW